MTPADYFDTINAIFRQEGWQLQEHSTGRSCKISNCGICEERLGIAKISISTDISFVFTWDASGPDELDADNLLAALNSQITEITTTKFNCLVGGDTPLNPNPSQETATHASPLQD